MNIIPVGFTYATYGGLTIAAVTLFGVFKYNQIPNIYSNIIDSQKLEVTRKCSHCGEIRNRNTSQMMY